MTGITGQDFSGGGLFPGQMDLAQFTFGQNALQNAQAFSKGQGHSTGLTMADAGAYMGEATQAQQMSQADIGALTNFQNQNKANLGNTIGGLGSTLGSFA